MSDWFETRFREPVGGDELDPAFAARVRALVVEEWRAGEGSMPSRGPGAAQYEGDIIMLETEDPKAAASPRGRARSTRTRWLRVAAAAVLVAAIGGVAYLASDDDEEIDVVSPVPSPSPVDVTSVTGALEPGTYFVDPDGEPSTPLTVSFGVEADGWSPWLGTSKEDRMAVSITTVSNVVADGCAGDAPADPPVGPTVDDLAAALTHLAPFEVAEPPTDVVVDGYGGTHLVLRVPDLPRGADGSFVDCEDGRIYSWISPLNGDGPDGGAFSGYNGDDLEEFWLLDVAGTRLMIQTWRPAGASSHDVGEIAAIVDSIRINP
jgi:hypothetical protein